MTPIGSYGREPAIGNGDDPVPVHSKGLLYLAEYLMLMTSTEQLAAAEALRSKCEGREHRIVVADDEKPVED